MVIEKKQIIPPAQRNRDRLSKGLSQFEYITQRQVLEKKSKEAAKQLDQQIKSFNFTNVNQVIELFNKIPSNIKKYMTIDKDKLMASVADKQAKTFNTISEFKSFYNSLPKSVTKNMSVNENYYTNKRQELINKLKEEAKRWEEKKWKYKEKDRHDSVVKARTIQRELENYVNKLMNNKDLVYDFNTIYRQAVEKGNLAKKSKSQDIKYKKKVKEYNDKLKEIENLISNKSIKRIEYKDNVPTKFYTDEGKVIDLKSFSKDTRKNIDKVYTRYITETAKAKKDLLKKQEEKYKKLEKDFQVALAGANLGFNTLNKYQTSKFTPDQQAKIYEAYKETVKPKFEKFKDMFAPNKKFYTDATNEILYRQAINSNAKILNKVNPSIKPIPFGSDIKKFNELNNKINNYIQTLEDINKKVQKSVSLDLKKKAESITNKVLTGQSVTPKQYQEYQKFVKQKIKEKDIETLKKLKFFLLAPVKYGENLVVRVEAGEKYPLIKDVTAIGKRAIVITINDVVDILYLFYGVKGIPKNLKGDSYDGLVAKATRKLLKYEQDIIKSDKPLKKIEKDVKKLSKSIVKTIKRTGEVILDAGKLIKEHPYEAFIITMTAGSALVGGSIEKSIDLGTKTSNWIKKNPKEAFAQSLSFFVPEAVIKAGNKLYKGGKLVATSEKAKKLAKEAKLVSELVKTKTIKTITKNLEGLKNIVKDVKLIKQTKAVKTTKPIIKDIKLESNVKKILDDIDKYLYDKNKLKVKLKKYSKQLSDEEIGKLFKFLESGNEKKTIELITDFTKRKVLDTLNKEELLRVLQKHVRKPEEFSKLKKYYLKRFPNEKIRVKDEVVRALTRKKPKTKSYTEYTVNKDGSISKKVIKEVKKKAKEYTVTKEGKIVKTKKLRKELNKKLLEEAINSGNFKVITKDMILDKKKFEKLINSLNLDKKVIKKLQNYVSSINEYYNLEKINKKLTLVHKPHILKSDTMKSFVNDLLKSKKAQARTPTIPAKKYYNKAKRYLKKVRTFEQKAQKYINNPKLNKKLKELKEIKNKINKSDYQYLVKQNKTLKNNIKKIDDFISDLNKTKKELTKISEDIKLFKKLNIITNIAQIIENIRKLVSAIKTVQNNLNSQKNKLQNLFKNVNQLQQKFKQPVKQKIPKRPKKPKKTKIKKPNMKKPRIPKKIKETKLIKPVQPIPIKPPKIPKIKEQEKIHKFKIPKLPKPSPSSPKRKSYQVRFYDGNKLKVVTPNTAPLKRAANFARKFIKKNKSKINRYLLVEVGTTRIPDVTKTIYDNDFAGTIKNARLMKR